MNDKNYGSENLEDAHQGAEKPSWYVAYTQPKSEKLAVDNLIRQGFETYCPQYKTFKKTATGSLCQLEVMFPRYMFFTARRAPVHLSRMVHPWRFICTVLRHETRLVKKLPTVGFEAI